MSARTLFGPLIASAIAAVCAGCSLPPPPPPYVYNPAEFDREAAAFNQPLDLTEGVVVCYNSRSATPAEIRHLAGAECARIDQPAVFVGHVYDLCPALLVSGAKFTCGSAAARSGGGDAGSRAYGTGGYGVPGTPSASYGVGPTR